MSEQQSEGTNRRETFRLNDTVSLRIRLLDDDLLEEISGDFYGFRLRYSISSHLQNQRQVRKPKLIRIRKSSPDIAAYLEILEEQIYQLAERLDDNCDSESEAIQFTDNVDLSATGMRFNTELPITQGMVIEIGMVLSTYNTQVVMLGEVLRTEDVGDRKISVSIRFTHIHPEDTEAIMRHLARLQQFRLQECRGFG